MSTWKPKSDRFWTAAAMKSMARSAVKNPVQWELMRLPCARNEACGCRGTLCCKFVPAFSLHGRTERRFQAQWVWVGQPAMQPCRRPSPALPPPHVPSERLRQGSPAARPWPLYGAKVRSASLGRSPPSPQLRAKGATRGGCGASVGNLRLGLPQTASGNRAQASTRAGAEPARASRTQWLGQASGAAGCG
jgi:hypothetical protein